MPNSMIFFRLEENKVKYRNENLILNFTDDKQFLDRIVTYIWMFGMDL